MLKLIDDIIHFMNQYDILRHVFFGSKPFMNVYSNINRFIQV